VAGAAALALTAGGCSAGSDAQPPAGSRPTSSAPALPDQLTFGVYGPSSQLRAFRATVDDWNAKRPGQSPGEDASQDGQQSQSPAPARPQVRLQTWGSDAAMRRALQSGAPVPDVFLASRSDLRWLLDQHLTQPVDQLLDDRGVDFGDRYSREAIEAFSSDDRLQCMPFGLSPMVVYYNTSLVDFDRMRKRGYDVPDLDNPSWTFDQFAAAARFASRRAPGGAGVQVPATLDGLSPFIASGGGAVWNDGTQPTSLSLSSDDSRAALERTLTLLRDPRVTLSPAQLAKATPLQWFERGQLGMITGFRDLVPQLRMTPGLSFDVMPMPAVGSNSSTVGDVSGLCLSRKAASTPLAADFMVHEISPASVAEVTRTGYLYPANLQVGLTDDFLQPGRRPEHAQVFNSAVRAMQLPPLIDDRWRLERAIEPYLRELVYGVGALDLDGLTARIDARSRAVLDPGDAGPSGSSSPRPSAG
jgi:multiple sugar transport system substrate-binding protein